MKFNELQVKPLKKSRRLGRGISSGRGKTAGRGTKGQGARAGSTKKPGFSGGSNPLMQKLPKLPGFKSRHAKPKRVYTDDLNKITKANIDAVALAEAGLIASPYLHIKLLYRGDVTKKLSVQLPSASQKAIDSIESSGGSFTKTERLKRQPKTTK